MLTVRSSDSPGTSRSQPPASGRAQAKAGTMVGFRQINWSAIGPVDYSDPANSGSRPLRRRGRTNVLGHWPSAEESPGRAPFSGCGQDASRRDGAVAAATAPRAKPALEGRPFGRPEKRDNARRFSSFRRDRAAPQPQSGYLRGTHAAARTDGAWRNSPTNTLSHTTRRSCRPNVTVVQQVPERGDLSPLSPARTCHPAFTPATTGQKRGSPPFCRTG